MNYLSSFWLLEDTGLRLYGDCGSLTILCLFGLIKKRVQLWIKNQVLAIFGLTWKRYSPVREKISSLRQGGHGASLFWGLFEVFDAWAEDLVLREINIVEKQDSWAKIKEDEVEAHLEQGGVYGEAVVLGSLTTLSSGLLARAPLVLGSSSIKPWIHLSKHEDWKCTPIRETGL